MSEQEKKQQRINDLLYAETKLKFLCLPYTKLCLPYTKLNVYKKCFFKKKEVGVED